MSRDTLFLLKEDFLDGPGAPYFCPDCALVTGLLTYFPKLRHGLDIQYVDFAKPRSAIVAMIGEGHQGCPVLILSQPPSPETAAWMTGQSNGKSFVAGAMSIAKYWSAVHGVSRPH